MLDWDFGRDLEEERETLIFCFAGDASRRLTECCRVFFGFLFDFLDGFWWPSEVGDDSEEEVDVDELELEDLEGGGGDWTERAEDELVSLVEILEVESGGGERLNE